MDVTANQLNPAPVILEIKGILGGVKHSLGLLPFSVGVQVWADEHFATNADGDNGLDIMAYRINKLDRDAICRVTHELLKDKTKYKSPLAFKKKFQKSALAIQAMCIALDQAIKKSKPDLIKNEGAGDDKKKVKTGPLST